MTEINVFSVWPFGMQFPTSDMSITHGDTNHAFFKAHLAAARQAAQLMIPSWVLRDDVEYRMYFGPGAEGSPASDLYKILQMGLASYWDRPTSSWRPLLGVLQPEEKLAERLMED